MSTLRLHARADGQLELAGIDFTVAYCLGRVQPVLAARADAGVRDRLHPDAVPGDAARNAEWHRLMDGELRHLFEAAQATFARDLEAFDPRTRRVAFPADHLKAWMSAINQARVVLAEQHQIDATDLQSEDFSPGSPRDSARLQVHVLGYVLQVLVEHALEGA